jgi:hypothetical protein
VSYYFMSIYDLIEAWGLGDYSKSARRFTKKEVDSFIEEVDDLYKKPSVAKLGSSNPGLQDSLTLLSSPKERIQTLSSTILLSEKVWLPDPIFSAIAPSAASVWGKMPDSGSTYFTGKGKPPIHTGWKPLVHVKASERKSNLRDLLTASLPKIQALKALHAIGAVGFYSWERVAEPHVERFRELVVSLQKSEFHDHAMRAHPQDQYSLGARLSGISITLASDNPLTGAKAGAKLWVGDTVPILVYGLLNAAIASELCCRFEPRLPGDRLAYDFVRMNGRLGAKSAQVGEAICLPTLNTALFEDLIAIRRDSELLATFRKLLTDISQSDTDVSLEAIRDALTDTAARIREDGALRRVFGANTVDLLISLLGGITGAAVTGELVTAAIIGIVASIGTTYFAKLAVAAFGGEASKTNLRNEVITRVAKKL